MLSERGDTPGPLGIRMRLRKRPPSSPDSPGSPTSPVPSFSVRCRVHRSTGCETVADGLPGLAQEYQCRRPDLRISLLQIRTPLLQDSFRLEIHLHGLPGSEQTDTGGALLAR